MNVNVIIKAKPYLSYLVKMTNTNNEALQHDVTLRGVHILLFIFPWFIDRVFLWH